MEIVYHMYWGWDMKFENNPLTGEPVDREAPFGRMTEEQLAAWRTAYNQMKPFYRKYLRISTGFFPNHIHEGLALTFLKILPKAGNLPNLCITGTCVTILKQSSR